jgi:predicted transcriptional regulator
MVTTSQIPDWIATFQRYCVLLAGELMVYHDFSEKDIGVYVFLITQKWEFKKTRFSPNEILSNLSTIRTYLPKKHKVKYNDRTVRESLKTLENLGFIKKCENSERISTGGSPARAFYETTKITDLQVHVQSHLEDEIAKKLNSLSKLADIEESFSLQEITRGNENNDRR